MPNYTLAFKPRARKDLKALSSENLRRILEKMENLTENLAGDVKKLTNFTPEYRLRVGDTASCSKLKAGRSSSIVLCTAARLIASFCAYARIASRGFEKEWGE